MHGYISERNNQNAKKRFALGRGSGNLVLFRGVAPDEVTLGSMTVFQFSRSYM